MTCLKEVTRYQLCINVHHKKHMHWVEYNYIFIGCSTGAAWQLICQYWTHLLQIWPLLLLICCPYVLYYMLHAGYVARFNTSFWLLCRSSFIEKTKNFFWFFYYFFKELFLELYKDVWRHVSIIRRLICSLISHWVSPIIYCWYLGFSHIVMNSFCENYTKNNNSYFNRNKSRIVPQSLLQKSFRDFSKNCKNDSHAMDQRSNPIPQIFSYGLKIVWKS